ncbi:hypothetical protein [Sulfurisphaera ohwakuensis]|uniref:Uncharacterized protein n=1 Tax=Sulfurisphaera ohwakuensis TaxID=69656 RepID=A0A7J9RW23_SULOH|nr:hypothetical protein [Sulfurisphaera ohwakuensis]MBB5255208.1 hypothetical protein [Sulfurisphaera ohwakuensis]
MIDKPTIIHPPKIPVAPFNKSIINYGGPPAGTVLQSRHLGTQTPGQKQLQ